jgi:hypothetical protein
LAQSLDSNIKKIVDADLLKTTDVVDFKQMLSNQAPNNPSSYLIALYYLEFKKLTGHYPNFGSYVDFGDEAQNDKQQQKINAELLDYLSKLQEANLITDIHFSKYEAQINQNEYIHIFALLNTIYYQIQREDYFNPSMMKSFADSLRNKGISTNQNYSNLIKIIEARKISNSLDFLNFGDQSLVIELEHYSDEPTEYLEVIHKQTADLLPILHFDSFKYEIVLNQEISESDHKFYRLITSIYYQGKVYQHSSSISPDYKNKYEKTMKYFGKIGPSYYKIFNKILADQQSPYRLHYVNKTENNVADYNAFGIIALTKEQAKYLHHGGVFFAPSYENFKNNITTEKINEAIKFYKKIGLLSHLSDYETQKSIKKIDQQEHKNLNQILECFPNVIHWFDMELGNLENPYVELVERYSEISHTDFNPTDIKGDFDIELKKQATINFKINDKRYAKKLRIQNDWMDGAFFDFIESVIKEHNLKGSFYSLYEGGQGAMIIYLTPKQYEQLRKNKFAIFEDEWKSQEEEY